ncbi:MAG: hypothetical protein J5709_01485 [Bacteroidales bacterium]|nr:hypothetical protein [Bacteroidales bacterium]
MENIFLKMEQFLLNNAWGVIIAGIIASIVGTALCYAFKKLIEFLKKKLNIKKEKQRFLKYTEGFYRGASAAYSKHSSYRQVLLVGDFLMDALFEGLKILVYLLATSIFISFSESLWIDLLLIAVCSFMIYPRYLSLRNIEKTYKQTYDYIFGEDFTEKCVKGAIETLKKKQEDANEESDTQNTKSL